MRVWVARVRLCTKSGRARWEIAEEGHGPDEAPPSPLADLFPFASDNLRSRLSTILLCRSRENEHRHKARTRHPDLHVQSNPPSLSAPPAGIHSNVSDQPEQSLPLPGTTTSPLAQPYTRLIQPLLPPVPLGAMLAPLLHPSPWQPSHMNDPPEPPPQDTREAELAALAAQEKLGHDGKRQRVRPRRTVDPFGGLERWKIVRYVKGGPGWAGSGRELTKVGGSSFARPRLRLMTNCLCGLTRVISST